MTCKTCKYAISDGVVREKPAFYCRRYPPQIVISHNNTYGPQLEQHFPWMEGDQSCGEYRL